MNKQQFPLRFHPSHNFIWLCVPLQKQTTWRYWKYCRQWLTSHSPYPPVCTVSPLYQMFLLDSWMDYTALIPYSDSSDKVFSLLDLPFVLCSLHVMHITIALVGSGSIFQTKPAKSLFSRGRQLHLTKGQTFSEQMLWGLCFLTKSMLFFISLYQCDRLPKKIRTPLL